MNPAESDRHERILADRYDRRDYVRVGSTWRDAAEVPALSDVED